MGFGHNELPAGKWVTVGFYFGLPRRITIKVANHDVQCRWRRIGPLPWWGKFYREKTVWCVDSWIQVKSPVKTTCYSYLTTGSTAE